MLIFKDLIFKQLFVKLHDIFNWGIEILINFDVH